MRLIVAAGVALLALTGCAPDTSAAYTRCVDSESTLWRLQNPEASDDEYIDHMVARAEECSTWAEADPAAFNEAWGDD